MDEQKIKKEAKALDDALEKGITEDILPFFTDDCEIELFGIILHRKKGLHKAIRWMKDHLTNIKLIPIVIMVKNSTFFEEFVVNANTINGNEVKIKQAEVLEYDNDYKVKSLRLYFDRLILVKESTTNIFEKWFVNRMIQSSVKGLL